jgi:NAD(P)H dehydrogenase (quinone)
VPADALLRGMLDHGLPTSLAELYVSFDVAIARGDLAQITDTVQRLTKRTPQSVRSFLERQRASLLG